MRNSESSKPWPSRQAIFITSSVALGPLKMMAERPARKGPRAGGRWFHVKRDRSLRAGDPSVARAACGPSDPRGTGARSRLTTGGGVSLVLAVVNQKGGGGHTTT